MDASYYSESWHAVPTDGTGRVRAVKGPATPLLRELSRLLDTERSRLRVQRARNNRSAAAACQGRIDALLLAHGAVRSANHDIDRLDRVERELRRRAHRAHRRSRTAVFRRRAILSSQASVLLHASTACRKTVAAIRSGRAAGGPDTVLSPPWTQTGRTGSSPAAPSCAGASPRHSPGRRRGPRS